MNTDTIKSVGPASGIALQNPADFGGLPAKLAASKGQGLIALAPRQTVTTAVANLGLSGLAPAQLAQTQRPGGRFDVNAAVRLIESKIRFNSPFGNGDEQDQAAILAKLREAKGAGQQGAVVLRLMERGILGKLSGEFDTGDNAQQNEYRRYIGESVGLVATMRTYPNQARDVASLIKAASGWVSRDEIRGFLRQLHTVRGAQDPQFMSDVVLAMKDRGMFEQLMPDRISGYRWQYGSWDLYHGRGCHNLNPMTVGLVLAEMQAVNRMLRERLDDDVLRFVPRNSPAHRELVSEFNARHAWGTMTTAQLLLRCASQSGGGTGRPGSGTGRPGSGTGRPGSGTGRPGSGTGRPGSGTGRPGSGTGRPGSGTSRPGSGTGRPGGN